MSPKSWLRQLFIKLYFIFRLYLHGFWEMLVQSFKHVAVDNEISNRNYIGQTAFITGGASGIGLSVSRMFCELGVTVVAAGPHPFQQSALTKKMQKYIEEGKLQYISLDLNSFQSINDAVTTFSAKFQSLDYLINNAGIMIAPYSESEQGFECHMAVNFLGHVRLTNLLLPILNKSTNPRIVNVASSAHCIAPVSYLLSGKFFINPPLYSAHLSYALSKLAIILYTQCLADQLQRLKSPIIVCSVHPGVVASSLFRHVCSPLQFIQWYVFSPLFFRSVDDGAIPIVNCAFSADVSHKNGVYIQHDIDSYLLFISKTDRHKFWQTVGQLIHRSCKKDQ